VTRTGTVVDTVFRHFRLLRYVPRAPRSIDTARLEGLLADEGIIVHRRTIQRDLEALAGRFSGLTCNTTTKPYAWRWEKDATGYEVPTMGLSAAVTLELLRAHMREALPRATERLLHEHFERARQVIAACPGAKMARWPRKIRVQPRGLPRRATDVPPAVLDVVYGALLEERCFVAQYRPRGATVDREYEVNPLGLVLRHGTIVLVCTLWGYDDVVQLLLHRIRRALPIDKRTRTPPRFDLDAFVASGELGYQLDARPVRLRVRFHRDAALSLHESPISADQRITSGGEEHEILTATVPDTSELRAWLRSYGPWALVLGPPRLRREMAEDARRSAAQYR
jgi:predicted DNA-binding transcriptional regulator YafY